MNPVDMDNRSWFHDGVSNRVLTPMRLKRDLLWPSLEGCLSITIFTNPHVQATIVKGFYDCASFNISEDCAPIYFDLDNPLLKRRVTKSIYGFRDITYSLPQGQ